VPKILKAVSPILQLLQTQCSPPPPGCSGQADRDCRSRFEREADLASTHWHPACNEAQEHQRRNIHNCAHTARCLSVARISIAGSVQ
jgi:hypothetical protein